ncbi:MAG: DUF2147 domain-containing protein [Opitutales bacterium]
MKSPAFFLSLVAMLAMAAAAAASPSPEEAVMGVYWAPDKDAKIAVRISDDGTLQGRLIAVQPRRVNQRDEFNPDESIRNRRVLGIDIMRDFRYDADDGRWEDGRLYDPKEGKFYKGHLWLEDGDLKARGYVGFSLFGRTEVFEHVAGPNPHLQQEGEPELVHLATAPDSAVVENPRPVPSEEPRSIHDRRRGPR